MDFLLKLGKALYKFILSWIDGVQKAGLDPDWMRLLLILGGVSVWFGLACWASSIAESRRHNPKLHLAIGLLIPLFYPLILLWSMEVGKTPAELKKQEEDALKQSEVPAEADAEPEPAEPEAEFSPAGFHELMVRQKAGECGPWQITYDSRDVHVVQILDALPQVVVLEVGAPDGKTQRIRVPYSRIEAFQPLS
jgi:hypothetical protein